MSLPSETLFLVLAVVVLGAPLLLLAALGGAALFGHPPGERATSRATAACVTAALLAAVGLTAWMVRAGTPSVSLDLGSWIELPAEHFHFEWKFIFDRLSLPFLLLTLVLGGTVTAFADRYMHKEPGHGRFFLFFAVFLLGMVVATLAGTIETLFVGWELVGLASALLVAFYHERPAPVVNGQRIWSIYRLSDAAFLLAAVALHHLSGGGDLDALTGAGPWPQGQTALSAAEALPVGLLLLFAAAGKSALVPFSGWLPRAMEGPTPSSAVFYGALSVHLGAFLLLRVSPILEVTPLLGGAVVVVGLLSAAFGALAGRVQTDAKSALAYASMTQVGLITAEIGLGWRYVPLVHIVGHACLRTLQLLRAPSLLHDYHVLENAMGEGTGHAAAAGGGGRVGWYRLALDRGNFDAALDRFVVRPFLRLFRRCDRIERRWTAFLNGSARDPAAVPVPVSTTAASAVMPTEEAS